MRAEQTIHVFINRKKYDLNDPVQTGASLKRLAGIPLADVLFRQQPREDEVVPNDNSITLQHGDHLHSQPAADYGMGPTELAEFGSDPDCASLHAGPGGWKYLVISGFRLPTAYSPDVVKLLIKLPPLFPEAAPDMFWVSPPTRISKGRAPKATSSERLLNQNWQRFSWHLAPGEWKPGVSSLRDYLRCVHARFLRLN
jgi:hypothetical protein